MLSGTAPGERTSGYVLAGGRSSRMGTDKGSLPWRGTTLIRYVATEVEAAAGSVTIVGGGPIIGYGVLSDALAGAGPLGGIAAALEDTRAEWNLIVACDMPGIRRVALARLLQEAKDDVTLPVTSDGRMHPLCAVWHRSAGPAVRQAVVGGVRRVTDVVKMLRFQTVVLEDGVMANVNTPEEWARFEPE